MRTVEAVLGLNGVWQFEFLLAMLLRSSIMLVAVWAAAGILKHASARARQTIWTLGVAGLLVLPVLAPSTSAVRLVFEPPSSFMRIDNPAPMGSLREWVSEGLSGMGYALPSHLVAADPSGPGPGVFGWLFLIWAAVAIALLARLAVGTVRVRGLLREATPADHRLRAALENLGARTRRVRLLTGDAAVPFTFGWPGAVIVLPRSAVDWPLDRLQAVLAHELAHVTRHDWLRQVAGEVVACLYWIQPGLRAALRRGALEAELACDQAVLERGITRRSYAQCIVEVLREAGPGPRLASRAAIPFARTSEAEQRIRVLMRAGTPRPRAWLLAGASALVLLGIGSSAALGFTLGACEGKLPVRIERAGTGE